MKDQDLKIIDDYLDGRLPEEQSMSFEQRLLNEKDLKEEYEFRKAAMIYLRKEAGQEQIQSEISILNKEYFPSDKKEQSIKPERKPIKLYWIGLAAAAAITLLIIFNPFGQDDLYSKHAKHAPLALVQKSIDQDLIAKAESSFNQNDYSSAYIDLTNILADNPNDLNIKLALGICALELNKNQEAKQIFSQISESDSSFSEYGTWYLALASLKNDDKAGAKRYLDELNIDNDPYLLNKKNALMQDLQ